MPLVLPPGIAQPIEPWRQRREGGRDPCRQWCPSHGLGTWLGQGGEGPGYRLSRNPSSQSRRLSPPLHGRGKERYVWMNECIIAPLQPYTNVQFLSFLSWLLIGSTHVTHVYIHITSLVPRPFQCCTLKVGGPARYAKSRAWCHHTPSHAITHHAIRHKGHFVKLPVLRHSVWKKGLFVWMNKCIDTPLSFPALSLTHTQHQRALQCVVCGGWARCCWMHLANSISILCLG